MKTAQPFSWVVRFTVAPMWIQDGFTISDERAHSMLAQAVGGASNSELIAQVLEAPSALQIARMQGYGPQHPKGGHVVRRIIADTPNAGEVHRALIAARDLLYSVAFVANEGDTLAPLALIDTALAAINARQGDAVEIES